ncbi:MAG: alpha/beta hydrolase [Catenulispora sp.]|nr:alpha/beta hydrolase [Catenulispora sp.]
MNSFGIHPQTTIAIGTQPREPLRLDGLSAMRRSMIDATASEVGPGDRTVAAADALADGVPVRIYQPRGSGEQGPDGQEPGSRTPVAVFVHGGGWVMGGLDTHDGLCRQIAARSGCAVLAVDYRLAPEHPHPAALEDVELALTWARGPGGAAHRLDATCPAIIGESAGGHLAAAVCGRARDAGRPYACQVLVCPVIDPFAEYPDLDAFGLYREEMDFFWAAYTPDPATREHPDVAVLRGDLTGLPRTLVITAELDILRDEAERYADALAAVGVPVACVRYRGVNHAFVRKLALFDAAALAVDQIAGTLRGTLLPS